MTALNKNTVIIVALVQLALTVTQSGADKVGNYSVGPEILPLTPMTVFTASGMMAAMEKIAARYETLTGQKVILSAGASSMLARQIAAGAEVDVFVSANLEWMEFAERSGRIATETRRVLACDRLVLITQAGTKPPANDGFPERLIKEDGQIALGDPAHVPAGQYAMQAFERLGVWGALRRRIVPAPNVSAATRYVEMGQCRWGVVYQSGAVHSGRADIVYVFADDLYSPIQFTAAGMVGSDSAVRFLAFLDDPQARRIMFDCGFVIDYTDMENTVQPQTSTPGPAFYANEKQAIFLSLKIAAVCTLVMAVPGILLGYLLARKKFPGRNLLNSVVLLPLVLPPVVTGYAALILLGNQSLLGGWLNRTFGISIAFTQFGAILIAAVMGLPLLVRSVKISVEMIDRRYTLAAGTLGAGPLRAFLTITLPLAGPGVLAGMILAFARSLGEFGATAVFAGNLPGKTQTLSLAVYQLIQTPGGEKAAMRLVLISVLISFAAILLSEQFSRHMKTTGQNREA